MLAQVAQRTITQACRFFRLNYDSSRRRLVKAANYLQECAFPAAARAGNCDKLALANTQRNTTQRVNRLIAKQIML